MLVRVVRLYSILEVEQRLLLLVALVRLRRLTAIHRSGSAATDVVAFSVCACRCLLELVGLVVAYCQIAKNVVLHLVDGWIPTLGTLLGQSIQIRILVTTTWLVPRS